jgi:hypothetical protein
VQALEQWLVPLLELGTFWTLDLSDDELAQPIEAFVPLYRRAKAAAKPVRWRRSSGALTSGR